MMGGAIARWRADARDHQRAMAQWEAIRDRLPERTEASSGLTICSVAYRAKACLALNDRLMRQLNSGARPSEWLLFDNNTDPAERIDAADPRFTIVRSERRSGELGYEHALGIGELMTRVRTRFLLILDPDCFIAYPDWIRTIPAYMVERGLGFFGPPINPRRHNSYRYFPYMVCMFVDLARVSRRDLCFIPDVWEPAANVGYRIRKAAADLPKVGFLFRWLLTEQWRTNGWRLKAQFGDGRRVAFECAQPVWDIESELTRDRIKRLVHVLTPAAVSPIPKKPNYCSPRGFRAMGAPDVAALGWEEFVWNDRPFAFHIGSTHASDGQYVEPLSRILDAFAEPVAVTH
jgi:hypothetical protein